MTGKELDKFAKSANDISQHKIKLKKPVTYMDVEYTELEFDFDKLTGADSESIIREISAFGKTVLIPAMSSDYLMRVAMKACSAPVDISFFSLLSIRDYERIKTLTRNFFASVEW